MLTPLLADNIGPAVSAMVKIYGLHLKTLDIGWPAASAVAFGTEIGALVIPLGLLLNVVMLVTKTTKTLNIDLFNYWHYAFVGSLVSIETNSFWWGAFAAAITYIISMVAADRTQKKMENFYGEDLKGISITHGYTVAFAPFAIAINWVIERIPGLRSIDLDAEKMQKRFGILGDPIFLGLVIGAILGVLAQYPVDKIMKLAIILSAVMVLIPRITSMFIEGLSPISKRSQELISTKLPGRSFSIGMTPALLVGHPVTLVASLFLVPVILLLAVIIPGNQFLPLGSLAGLIYIFPLILPYTKRNLIRSFITGAIMMVFGLLFATSVGQIFTQSVKMVQANLIPAGTTYVGSIDFATSPLAWAVYELSTHFAVVGAAVLVVFALALMVWNRKAIISEESAEAVEAPEAAETVTGR
ncbi:PTS galactitol transporter subunit IIC [Secundilactobacillus oryzae]|nr:PTS transporter subunit IIC [Secundilactobacillus oryzae]